MTAPAVAPQLFGERLSLAVRYADWLAGAAVERGLLGPREADRVWERHVLNSTAPAELLPQGARVGDVGSGAGLPGIPLWFARPDVRMTLIEPLLRRAAFLDEVVADLVLPVRVLRARAEDVTEQFDVVVSRAVAPLDRLVRWCAPLVAPSGLLVAIKGRSAEQELAQHLPVLEKLGATRAEVRTVGTGSSTATVVVLAFTKGRSR
jgi:16S rRNA (guanine527-N7)-methyltransferase